MDELSQIGEIKARCIIFYLNLPQATIALVTRYSLLITYLLKQSVLDKINFLVSLSIYP